jgi:hypothetical protein
MLRDGRLRDRRLSLQSGDDPAGRLFAFGQQLQDGPANRIAEGLEDPAHSAFVSHDFAEAVQVVIIGMAVALFLAFLVALLHPGDRITQEPEAELEAAGAGASQSG